MIRLYRFLAPFKLTIAAILVLVFLQSLSNLYLPNLMANIVDHGIQNKDIGYILRVGGLMLVIAAFGLLCSLMAGFLSSRTAVQFGKIARREIFTRVESFSLHEFDRFGTATLITRTTNDVTQVQVVTVLILGMMISAPMLGIGGIIMAFSMDRPLTLVLAVAVPILILAIVLIARRSVPLFRLMQIKLDKLNLVLREGLTGIRVVRAFNRVERERERFEEANQDLAANAIRANQIIAALMPVLILVMNLTSVAIIWFGSIRINNGDMQVGSLIAFTQYAMQIMFAMLMLSMMFVMVPRAAAAATRINEVLDTVPDISDPEEPRRPGEQRGHVEFQNVTFRYPGAEQPAVSDISFAVGPGEVTAIIGGTGSGKSTLVNLLLRFYDIDSGSILVDGVDIRRMSQETLRAKMGFVPQKTVLLHRDHCRQSPLRKAGGRPGGSAQGRRHCPGPRVHFKHGRRPGVLDRPGRDQRLGRAETAAGDCPRSGAAARDLSIRRQLFGLGFQDRCTSAGGAPPGNCQCNGDHRRSARGHYYGRRSDYRSGRGSDRRHGYA